jgi:hypothetical protein
MTIRGLSAWLDPGCDIRGGRGHNSCIKSDPECPGMAAATEKNLLAGYLSTNNGTGIRSKLAEYKTWWQANKTVAISL